MSIPRAAVSVTVVELIVIVMDAKAACFKQMNILNIPASAPQAISLFPLINVCVRNCHSSMTLPLRFQGKPQGPHGGGGVGIVLPVLGLFCALMFDS